MKTFRTYLIVLVALVGLLQSAMAQKYEMRAVWLTTIGGIDWPHSYANGSSESIHRQQKELTDILDRLQAAGINTVLLQTRVRATTLYPSAYEPWDGCLSGQPGKSPGYDALQFAIDECHQRGMQLHAWIVTIPVGKWASAGCQQLRKRYPKLIKKIGLEGYMDPEAKETGDYLAKICEEIVKGYDVDGIHLDYLRYPETWKLRVSRQQGRQNITRIAQTVSRRVRQVKPWVMMSCSPIGKHDDLRRYSSRGWNARTTVCQDAQAWLKDGTMDALFPMMYFKGDHFYPFAIDWAEQSEGKIVAPGVATYMLDRHEGNWPLPTLTQELHVVRQLGMGHTHFRSKFLTDNTKGIYRFEKDFNASPALIPPMTWRQSAKPEQPKDLVLTPYDDGSLLLSWQSPNRSATTPHLLYNVYASRTCPVDVEDARHLVAMRLDECQLQLSSCHPSPQGFYYAVTAVDRYGNESQPCQSHEAAQPSATHLTSPVSHFPPLLTCNGKKLQLPACKAETDATMLCIETMQGVIVATRPYQGKEVDVSQLNEGFYQLRTLSRRGISHRLGFFMVVHRHD